MSRTPGVVLVVAVCLAFAAGCGGGGGSSCEDAVANGMKVSGMGGATYGADRARGVQMCKDQKWSEKTRSCFASAKAASALEACIDLRSVDSAGGKDPHAGRRTEAEVNLEAIRKGAKTYFVENAAYPTGNQALTPATPCCEGPNHKCAVDAALWGGDGLWVQLGFELVEPHRYRYAVESDGKTLTARATGDLDCDGTEITYELRCAAPEGTPSCELTKPATAD